MDGRYVRDKQGLSGSVKDSTVFTVGAKNGQSPDTWGTNPAGATVTDKTDIIDGYAHMRRDGIISSGSNPDHLLLFMGASTSATSGNRFVDLELYKSRLIYNKVTGVFSNQGPASTGGHTSWEFNADGTVAKMGDIDVTFDYSGTAVTDIGVYLWVAKTSVSGMTPAKFDFIGTSEFYGDGNNATYGYAKIKAKNGAALPVWGAVNTSTITAPVWGTNSKDIGNSANNYYSTQYATGQMAEVGIDFTALGIDISFNSSYDPCTPPFTRMMIKSRSSSSFTSALSDFAGPYEFLDAPGVPASILAPGNLACNIGSINLKPQIIIAGANYMWTTSGGNILGAANTPVITVNKPCKYYLTTTTGGGCSQLIDSVIVTGDYNQPVATANWQGTITAITNATLIGGDTTASNYMTPFGGSLGLTWSWSGPNSFTSTIQNPIVSVEGTYTLIVKEKRNGCTDTAIVYVPSALILPVTLVEFTGTNNKGTANLKWNTSSEINMNRFEIERSSDEGSFKFIGQLMAAGNSNVHVDYSFTDKQMQNGNNYYRLKMISTDGTYSYSRIIFINSNDKNPDAYLVYPNPFGSTLQVRIGTSNNEQALIRIINSDGKAMKVQLATLQAGVNNITMDAEVVTKGIYIIEVITPENTVRMKMVK